MQHTSSQTAHNSASSILVIGGDGVLGSALQNYCTDNGLKLFATTRNKKITEPNRIYLDLNDDLQTFSIEEYSEIIYVAQSREYKNFPQGTEDLIKINILAPSILAKKAAQLKKKFVYCSTGSIYAPSEGLLTEESSLKNQGNWDTYAVSKYFGEQMVLGAYSRALIVRPFFIFGNSSNNTSLFPNLLSSIMGEEEIRLKGERGLYFNPIAAHDAAAAILHLLDKSITGIFNLAGKQVIDLKYAVDLLGNLHGVTPKYTIESGVSKFVASISKLEQSGFAFEGKIEEKLALFFSELKLAKR